MDIVTLLVAQALIFSAPANREEFPQFADNLVNEWHAEGRVWTETFDTTRCLVVTVEGSSLEQAAQHVFSNRRCVKAADPISDHDLAVREILKELD
jgi:hypothetical protein